MTGPRSGVGGIDRGPSKLRQPMPDPQLGHTWDGTASRPDLALDWSSTASSTRCESSVLSGEAAAPDQIGACLPGPVDRELAFSLGVVAASTFVGLTAQAVGVAGSRDGFKGSDRDGVSVAAFSLLTAGSEWVDKGSDLVLVAVSQHVPHRRPPSIMGSAGWGGGVMVSIHSSGSIRACWTRVSKRAVIRSACRTSHACTNGSVTTCTYPALVSSSARLVRSMSGPASACTPARIFSAR